jgi:transcriptional regulator
MRWIRSGSRKRLRAGSPAIAHANTRAPLDDCSIPRIVHDEGTLPALLYHVARQGRAHAREELPTSIVRLCKEKLMKEAETKGKNELLPGTLAMLILKTLSIESMHGYGIAQHIQMLSANVLTIEEGSLYPALQRMLVKGWVMAEWKISANNRRARFYTLTTAGKKQLGVEESRFSQMFGAIMRVMKTT